MGHASSADALPILAAPGVRRRPVLPRLLYEFDEAGGSIEPVFRAVCQDQGMQDDPTNLDPDGFLIGHAFKGEFLYLCSRRARDVARRVGFGFSGLGRISRSIPASGAPSRVAARSWGAWRQAP